MTTKHLTSVPLEVQPDLHVGSIAVLHRLDGQATVVEVVETMAHAVRVEAPGVSVVVPDTQVDPRWSQYAHRSGLDTDDPAPTCGYCGDALRPGEVVEVQWYRATIVAGYLHTDERYEGDRSCADLHWETL